ncbi:YbaB/EbfC family nucleoid-associated protein [Actinoalloteichus spitiensis]|uniref:YbaB/EbfC family nucleoid-associated protein n=1 Tax=Actinoalloteichus spitiensis TaxID=252394 RepID=UPI0002F56506|nr:YbaB/EbfC family nucleoid-associated protein [Actinoalloteichus spitiensis]
MTAGFNPFSGQGLPDVAGALAEFEKQQARLIKLQEDISQASTTVDSDNKMLTVTLDGNGQLREIKVNTTQYRKMTPKELAEVLTKTLRKANSEHLKSMGELMGGSPIPNVDFEDFASGRSDFGELLQGILDPIVADQGAASQKPELKKPRPQDDGWDHDR